LYACLAKLPRTSSYPDSWHAGQRPSCHTCVTAATGGSAFTPFCILMAVSFCGCSYTEIGQDSRKSPDGRFGVSTECDGAYGHAYIDNTKKKFWVWIGSGSGTNYTQLFKHHYIINGSDVDWQTRWSSDEAVSIEIYDWGDGVGNYDNMKHLAASNHIASLSFTLDKSTGKFVEQR